MVNVKKKLKKLSLIRGCFVLNAMLKSVPYYIFRIFPIKKSKVVLVSFCGKYSGDPKCLSEALVDCDLDIVWLLDKPDKYNISGVRKVKYGSIKAIYELVTAKIWIDDCRKDSNVRKRKNQFYIGTGHGGIPMKMIEKDVYEKLPLSYQVKMENDSKMTDLKPSNSQWRNDMLRRAYMYSGEIYNCGLPRVERLIKKQDVVREDVRNKYSIGRDVHLYLYAPTFREIGDDSVYDIDFARVGKALKDKFGGEWIGLRKLHPAVKQYEVVDETDVVLDVTDYPDLSDLLMASDFLITDYSSCIFETLFFNIPAFIFALDLNDYMEKERGLYWDINKLPFPKATSNTELIELIGQFEADCYFGDLKEFKQEIGLFADQTHATELLVNRICEEIKK